MFESAGPAAMRVSPRCSGWPDCACHLATEGAGGSVDAGAACAGGVRARLQIARVRAKPHRAAQIRDAVLIGHQVNDWVFTGGIVFGAVGVL